MPGEGVVITYPMSIYLVYLPPVTLWYGCGIGSGNGLGSGLENGLENSLGNGNGCGNCSGK